MPHDIEVEIGTNQRREFKFPPQTFTIPGPAYRGLDLKKFKVGDRIKFVMSGKVTGLRENPIDDDFMDLTFEVQEISNASPRPGMDEDRRIIE
jgi:hypothetical protein